MDGICDKKYDIVHTGDKKMPTSSHKRGKRLRITFSLTPAAAGALRSYGQRIKSSSLSAALESLIQEWRLMREKRELHARVKTHYDSLSAEEMKEAGDWGQLSESQMDAEG